MTDEDFLKTVLMILSASGADFHFSTNSSTVVAAFNVLKVAISITPANGTKMKDLSWPIDRVFNLSQAI
jgi:hypothetical protein